MTQMEKYLNALIEEGKGEENGVPIQIVFEPGAATTAGGLRYAKMPGTGKRIEGMYELATVVKPGREAPLEIRKLDHIMITEVFSASAVQRVAKQVNVGAGGGIARGIIAQG